MAVPGAGLHLNRVLVERKGEFVFKLACYHHIVVDDDPLLSMFHGPTIDEFVLDLDYMQGTGDVWPLSAVVAALRAGEVPERTTWCVTFDDGLWSQSELAAPVLAERGLSAAFFVSSRGSAADGLLDVHKLQMLFARVRMEQTSIDDLQEVIAEMVPAGVLEEALARGGRWQSRFNPGPVGAVKGLLQRDLPQPMRGRVVEALFDRFVGEPAEEVAPLLYASWASLRELAESGMEIGGHGVSHPWLTSLDAAEAAVELQASFDLVTELGGHEEVVMCYPYGDFDAHTLRLARAAGFTAGVSTVSAPAGADCDVMAIPRFDAVDVARERAWAAEERL